LKGTGAPSNIHPNRLWKEHSFKVNHSQRTPHLAEAIQEDPERFNLLKEGFSEVLELARQNVSQVLLYDFV
jgi:hypothetical protein